MSTFYFFKYLNNNELTKKSMAKRNSTVSGSTRTNVEKKVKKERKPRPPRLTQEEKEAKYGKINKKELNYKINFIAKTPKQQELFDTVGDKIITMVKGSAGTGKSYTVFSKALIMLQSPNNNYKQILILVPTTPVEDIGYLPGDVNAKIEQATYADKDTIIKILDHGGNNGNEVFGQLVSAGLIKFDCISYWRGRTIDNRIVCISECSNLTPKNTKTALTRIGSDSCYILSGDPTQSDLPLTRNGKKQIDGLTVGFDKFKNVDSIGKIEFSKDDEIVRHPIIREILNAWEENEVF